MELFHFNVKKNSKIYETYDSSIYEHQLSFYKLS